MPHPAPAITEPVLRGPLESSGAGIYGPAALPGSPAARELEDAGFHEEEYLLSGTGSIFTTGDDGPVVSRGGVPFTVRLQVVRPTDPADFNGVVHLSGMHPFLGAMQWERYAHAVLSTGAIFVAVGTGTDARSRAQSTPEWPIAAPWVTRWFDSDRYRDLEWPDDDGLQWAVYSQTARMIRDRSSGLLPDLDVQRLYSSGWSHLGSFQRTFVNEGFHDLARREDGAPLIDGYVIGISSAWQQPGLLPINSSAPVAPIGDARRRLRPVDVPVIELLSQHEGQANNAPRTADVDQGPGRHRLYEVAGTSHQDLGVPVERSSRVQLARRHHPAAAPEAPQDFPDTDVPMRLFFAAVLENLDAWVTEGTPPPPSACLEFDAAGRVAVDDLGNPRGGIRSVELDVPLARYGEPSKHWDSTPGNHFIPMQRIPLAPAELARLYPGGREDYLRRAEERARELVAERRLRADDLEAELAVIRNRAGDAFDA